MPTFTPVDHDPFSDEPLAYSPIAVNQPFGELSAGPAPSPTQRIGNAFQNVLESAGAQPSVARHLREGLGGILSASPLGVVGSAADAVDANAKGDGLGTVQAMAGMIPGAGPVERKISEEVAPLLRVPRWPEGTKPIIPLTQFDMAGNSRVEDVPLSKVFSGQADRDMRWGDNSSGKYGDTQIPGYGDRPVVVKMPDGNYHLQDGNHRTALAMQRGDEAMPMHVIDYNAFDSGIEGPAPALGTPTFKYAEHYPDSQIMHVDAAKFDKAWQIDPRMHVGELGQGGDAGKYGRAKSFLWSKPESFEAP
jgi:hypothetical protein